MAFLPLDSMAMLVYHLDQQEINTKQQKPAENGQKN